MLKTPEGEVAPNEEDPSNSETQPPAELTEDDKILKKISELPIAVEKEENEAAESEVDWAKEKRTAMNSKFTDEQILAYQREGMAAAGRLEEQLRDMRAQKAELEDGGYDKVGDAKWLEMYNLAADIKKKEAKLKEVEVLRDELVQVWDDRMLDKQKKAK